MSKLCDCNKVNKAWPRDIFDIFSLPVTAAVAALEPSTLG